MIAMILRVSQANGDVIFFSQSSHYGRMKLLNALINTNLQGDLKDRSLAIIKRFKAPTRLRNELAHAEWVIDQGTGHYIATVSANLDTVDQKPLLETKAFDKGRINEIDQACRVLSKIVNDIIDLNEDLRKRPLSE